VPPDKWRRVLTRVSHSRTRGSKVRPRQCLGQSAIVLLPGRCGEAPGMRRQSLSPRRRGYPRDVTNEEIGRLVTVGGGPSPRTGGQAFALIAIATRR
jgi:hypothetical protein